MNLNLPEVIMRIYRVNSTGILALLVLLFLLLLVSSGCTPDERIDRLKKENEVLREDNRRLKRRVEQLVDIQVEKIILYMGLLFLGFNTIYSLERYFEIRAIFTLISGLILNRHVDEPQGAGRRSLRAADEEPEQAQYVEVEEIEPDEESGTNSHPAEEDWQDEQERTAWRSAEASYRRKKKLEDELGQDAAEEITRDAQRRIDQSYNNEY